MVIPIKMKSIIKVKNECNIFMPRTVYSLYLILSKSKSKKKNNFIIINSFNLQKISNELITLLKKKFTIIFVHKNYSYNTFKRKRTNPIKNFFGINHFSNLKNISNEILNTTYDEFEKINFKN